MTSTDNDFSTGWLSRTNLLLGSDKLRLLTNAHVLVAGVGGVGAYAAEMLCRAGVGKLTIVDADVVNPSNRNRQLLALSTTEGKKKAELMAERLLAINPQVEVITHVLYLNNSEIEELLTEQFDFVVDAIDTLSPKSWLIKTCVERGIPLVSAMGAGAKLDPTKIEITDISKSHHCPLAHMLRKRLHRMGIRRGFKVVFSSELPITEAVELCDNEPNKKSIVGTISYMPAIFGCFCASVVIKGLTEPTNEEAELA